jgi:hypothetical protein
VGGGVPSAMARAVSLFELTLLVTMPEAAWPVNTTLSVAKAAAGCPVGAAGLV